MAAGATYTPIATTTLGSTQASYTFSSISGSYTDLRLIANGTIPGAGDLKVVFNSDTASNYSWSQISGDGASTYSSRGSNFAAILSYTATTSLFVGTMDLLNYSNATTYKTTLSRGNQADGRTMAYVNCWRSTAAINSITISHAAGNLQSGSTFTLYGIASSG